MLNLIFWKKVQGQKHPGRWGIVEHQIPSIKVLFKTNAKSRKHPGIKLLSSESKKPWTSKIFSMKTSCRKKYNILIYLLYGILDLTVMWLLWLKWHSDFITPCASCDKHACRSIYSSSWVVKLICAALWTWCISCTECIWDSVGVITIKSLIWDAPQWAI